MAPIATYEYNKLNVIPDFHSLVLTMDTHFERHIGNDLMKTPRPVNEAKDEYVWNSTFTQNNYFRHHIDMMASYGKV